MERNGPNLIEDDHNQDDYYRFNEIISQGFEQHKDDEEDDKKKAEKKKKETTLNRLFGRFADVEAPEPDADKPAHAVESSFGLPFLQRPEITDEPDTEVAEILTEEPMVHPHHETPVVIEPEDLPPLHTDEFTDATLEDLNRYAEEHAPDPEPEDAPETPFAYARTPLVPPREARSAEPPSETEIEEPAITTPPLPAETPVELGDTDGEPEPAEEPPAPPPPVEDAPVPGGEAPEVAMGGGYVPPHEHPQYATHEEAKHYAAQAGLVGVGAAVLTGLAANSRAKTRERKLERRSEKRDKELDKKLQEHRQAIAAEQNRLQEQLEARRIVSPAPEKKTMAARTMKTPPLTRLTPEATAAEQQSRPPHAPEMPHPRPLNERYNPERHDMIPPRQAFEQLTGMERPEPQTPEAERRHEIMDEPTAVPRAYTAIDPDSPWNPSLAASPRGIRMNRVNTTPHNNDSRKNAESGNRAFSNRHAIISGLATAAVIIGAIFTVMLFMR